MFSGYDFVYNGKSSISENVKMLYTDSNAFTEAQGIPEKEYSIFKPNQSGKWNVSGINHENPLEFEMQIMLHGDGEDEYRRLNPVLKRNLISKISHWLFDVTDFHRLQIFTEELRDLYFMAVFKSPQYILDAGEIIGFRVTVLCDNIGAYEDKTVKKHCTGQTKISLQCLHDGIYEITPCYKIKLNTGAANITVNDTKIELKALAVDSTVTIDAETLIAKSDDGENLYVGDRFNLAFPTLRYGKNTITVDGDCEFEIKYSLVREAGC